ncbi:MAG: PAS domain-containing sensor histidine kinase [Methanoregula sp.]|jgi:PAS domain S-box-containing protein|uniref:PAS domain S-box protein n=1 Tax=Methanoregula sp. TaxID=2052170 RepID=UPI003D0B76B9
MDRYVHIRGYRVSHTDIVRLVVIASLTFSCIFITSLSLARHVETIYAQLFYFPILYATYFYPRRGLYLAGFCAVVYEVLAYVYVFPDIGGLIYTTGQAILFVCVAALVAYFTEKVNTSESRYRSIFETSLLGIVLFDQNTFSIKFANSYLARLLGYSEEDLPSMGFSRLFHAREGQRRFFEYLGSHEDIPNFETTFAQKNGEPVWVNLSWSRITGNLVSCSVIDINQRKLAEQAAEENYIQYKQVTENAPTCILILRANKIEFANPTFRAFTGYEPDELTGKELLQFLHPEDQSRFPLFSDTPDSRLPLPGMTELRFVTKNGEIRLATLFFTRIKQKGDPAVLINLVDITEYERLKATIQQDNERRRGILSTVAHELRTPLQPIMGYLSLLTQDPKTYGVTDETRTILDRCAKNVDRERQIINQMLELSVLDSGKIPLKYSVFSVPEMIKTITDAGGYMTKADLTVDVPADLTFDADENKISVVIDSMLSNAVNYSKPPRRIRISYQSASHETMHRLSIRDNGVGITNTQLDEIFEPFQLPDSANMSRKYDRIGLSLSIAKKYIQMHGGFISVDSIVNLGSTFTIHLPKQKKSGYSSDT